MKIAFLASEAVPYAKTGGLADVVGALPKVLARAGHEVKVILPFYRCIRNLGIPLLRAAADLTFDWDGGPAVFSVWEEATGRSSPCFIEKNDYFERDGLYGTAAGDYPDNGERFAFYCRAALHTLKVLDFAPDILHIHDWQAALSLAYLRQGVAEDFFSGTKSLFTIHNLAYQGLFDPSILGRIGLPPELMNSDALEFFGKAAFIKSGLLYAAAINTVSPRYSREIQTPEYGCGLDGLLRMRSGVLSGILNGADYSTWDPASDPALVQRYSADDLTGKAACRRDLLAAFGLPEAKKDSPVIGIVSRLAGQKGLDILVEALSGLMAMGVRVVILGQGEAAIESSLKEAARRYPSFFGLRIAFDEPLARKIYAGSDMFLIPSRYEPCGLTQMYSLKYGTVPIVRATGGLDDTVQEYDAAQGTGNGFKFEAPEAGALLGAVRRAAAAFARKSAWMKIVGNGMACDFSWERAAASYLGLYQQIPGLRKD